MKRRSFLKLLGVTPFIGIAATADIIKSTNTKFIDLELYTQQMLSLKHSFTDDVYTILFVEPDFAHKEVEAWLCTNMFPKAAGEVTGKRDLSAAGEMLTYSVEMPSMKMC